MDVETGLPPDDEVIDDVDVGQWAQLVKTAIAERNTIHFHVVTYLWQAIKLINDDDMDSARFVMSMVKSHTPVDGWHCQERLGHTCSSHTSQLVMPHDL